jgi:hypothetical protein
MGDMRGGMSMVMRRKKMGDMRRRGRRIIIDRAFG